MLHPQNDKACVRYYYLPARNGNNAEIIEVLNSRHDTIDVPTLEEDVILEPFYTRPMTFKELKNYNFSETWIVFNAWNELQSDHERYGVGVEEMTALTNFKTLFSLSENLVA